MEELAIMDKKGLIKVPEVLKNEKESWIIYNVRNFNWNYFPMFNCE
jgi:hypothetical protein